MEAKEKQMIIINKRKEWRKEKEEGEEGVGEGICVGFGESIRNVSAQSGWRRMGLGRLRKEKVRKEYKGTEENKRIQRIFKRLQTFICLCKAV